ncbi:MAG: hypothetical protein JSS34_05570 [Proteobacteria bacterium]|nr:hypothetical protein [Pseudomonadota bacterium]
MIVLLKMDDIDFEFQLPALHYVMKNKRDFEERTLADVEETLLSLIAQRQIDPKMQEVVDIILNYGSSTTKEKIIKISRDPDFPSHFREKLEEMMDEKLSQTREKIRTFCTEEKMNGIEERALCNLLLEFSDDLVPFALKEGRMRKIIKSLRKMSQEKRIQYLEGIISDKIEEERGDESTA